MGRGRAHVAFQRGGASAHVRFSGVCLPAYGAADRTHPPRFLPRGGQSAVRVHVVGIQQRLSVVSHEFLFGADRRLPVPEHTGVVAMVGSREAIAFRIP